MVTLVLEDVKSKLNLGDEYEKIYTLFHGERGDAEAVFTSAVSANPDKPEQDVWKELFTFQYFRDNGFECIAVIMLQVPDFPLESITGFFV